MVRRRGARIVGPVLIATPHPRRRNVVAPVHDRMPVILPREGLAAWLHHPDADVLVPAEAGMLVGTPVSPRVNSVKFDDPECLAPPPPESPDPRAHLKLI